MVQIGLAAGAWSDAAATCKALGWSWTYGSSSLTPKFVKPLLLNWHYDRDLRMKALKKEEGGYKSCVFLTATLPYL